MGRVQESILFMKIDGLTAKGRGFIHGGRLTMQTSKDIMESLGVSWDFVRVESMYFFIFFFRGKNKLREKPYIYMKIAFGHHCACSWTAEFYSRCQEASKHLDSYTEFPESRTPNDVIIYSLARVAA